MNSTEFLIWRDPNRIERLMRKNNRVPADYGILLNSSPRVSWKNIPTVPWSGRNQVLHILDKLTADVFLVIWDQCLKNTKN